MPLSGSEEDVNENMKSLGLKGRFERCNYFGDSNVELQQSVLKKANELAGGNIKGNVYFLGQIKQFGYYFSPVNFYFIQNEKTDDYTHMLAEVSNTPWNETHCYLVDLKKQEDQNKEFHVSPFNPMNMLYKWKILTSENTFRIQISCYRKELEFEAEMIMQKNFERKRNFMFTTFKIILGIYIHAFILFLKRTPIYSHPRKLD